MATPTITDAMTDAGRQAPSNSVLEELGGFRFFADDVLDRAQTIALAERLLKGDFALPRHTPFPFRVPFDASDLEQGPPSRRLAQARLLIPRVWLQAYRYSGRDDFLFAARDMILGFAEYERRAVFPKGLLWSDHAVAERILTLADFWALYRHHPRYEARVARELFIFVARSGRLLADPSHFTVSTNHGVMQNLALWHLCLAFPSLPRSPQYRQLALDRLTEQLEFYVNNEGIVLEHSAGYHEAGVQFLSLAVRYMTLLDIPVPPEWREKYESAKAVYAVLRRPDGTLPVFGDTGTDATQPGPAVTRVIDGRAAPLEHRVDWALPQSRRSYPVAGYTVWWDGLQAWPRSPELGQTVVAWSFYPGLAHKHADEMSVLVWAAGHTWWTNVGYWPYGVWGRREAESWNGSNAPHLTRESDASVRSTRLLGQGFTDNLAFIDLERRGPDVYAVRRQVLHSDGTRWVVIDHTRGRSEDRTTTVWTAASDATIGDGAIPGSYEVRHGASSAVLTTFIMGSPGTSTRHFRGSRSPFAGWAAQTGGGRPAPAIVVEQPANDSWAATIWSLSDDGRGARRIVTQPAIRTWDGPEKWALELQESAGRVLVSRDADKILVQVEGVKDPFVVTLSRPDGIEAKVVEIRESHRAALAKYQPFADLSDYRLKATFLVLLLFAVQELVFAAYPRLAGAYYTPRQYAALRVLAMVAWIVLGLWLVLIRERLI